LKTARVSAFTFFIRKESNKETLHGIDGEASLAYYFSFLLAELVEKVHLALFSPQTVATLKTHKIFT
jgi:hypothetical protein